MQLREETFGKNLILVIYLNETDINNRKLTEDKLISYIKKYPLKYFAVQMHNDNLKNYPNFEIAFNHVAKLDEN